MRCRKYINERSDPVYVTEPTVKLVIETYEAERREILNTLLPVEPRWTSPVRPSDDDLLKLISETIFAAVEDRHPNTPIERDAESIGSDEPWCIFPGEVAAAVIEALRGRGWL